MYPQPGQPSGDSSTNYSPNSSPSPPRKPSKWSLFGAEDVGLPTTSRHVRTASLPPVVGVGRISRRRTGTVLAVLGLVCTGTIWVNSTSSTYSTKATVPSEMADTLSAVTTAHNDVSLSPTTTTVHHPNWPDLTPPTPIQTWGVSLSADNLLAGLTPWPPNPPFEDQPPLSDLGHFADNTYKLGPLTLMDYHAQLTEFIDVALPKGIRKHYHQQLDRYLVGENKRNYEKWDEVKSIWQTDKDEGRAQSKPVLTWRQGLAKDEGWEWEMVTDAKADAYVSKYLKGSQMETLWKVLPSGILRSDMLRYLLLFLEGGIYTDTDTTLLKSPGHWGQGARLWRDGAGWLESAKLDRLAAGESPDDVLGPPSVVVGVEADVGGREDWNDWWPRPMQIVQWTMASAPGHPIALGALLRILHATSDAVLWAQNHARAIRWLKDQGRYDESKKLLETDVLAEPRSGGPLGVMAWTGPGVWTDAVLSYLRVKYGVLWTDLRNLDAPLRVGDVVILPVTGFSPGVGNFGSQMPNHREAMVEHTFRGSWKTPENSEIKA